MPLRRKKPDVPATALPDDLGRDLAPPLFGYFLEPDGQGAMRLVDGGVVLRRVGSPDTLLRRESITGARVDDEVLVLNHADGETVFSADDTAGYGRWLAALPADPAHPAHPAPPAPSRDLAADPQAGVAQTRVDRSQDHHLGWGRGPGGSAPGGSAPGRSAPALVGRATRPAVLALEDGRVFRGEAFGAEGESFGEAVFNTGMTGYQETLTDPSYHRQVVTMTAPHVGNTGMNVHDMESDRVWVAGYVVREPARVASSWRAERSLDAVLRESGVVGVAGVDTRAITRHLRERGAMRCVVSTGGTDADALVQRVLDSPAMDGADLAREVSTTEAYVVSATGERRFRVAALDLGMKRSIPAYLAAAGCEVHVLPATATADDLLAVDPDGVFVSNGPGDPAATSYAVDALRGVLGRRPVFGICLGHQILGQALGLGTYKLRFGHRGLNQPVQDLATGRVAITSHNHGFAVAPPADVRTPFESSVGRVQVSHVDLNDGVVEGLRCLDVPAFSVQYHPEAAPGPHDAADLFDRFAELMAREPVRA